MSTNRRAKPTEMMSTGSARGLDAARIQAALDASGLAVRVNEAGEFDARTFAEATMARWPKVMKKLGE